MTYREYFNQLAAKFNKTYEEIRVANSDFLCSEGYDDLGREYATLEDWIANKPIPGTGVIESYDPIDGGRGAGMLGVDY